MYAGKHEGVNLKIEENKKTLEKRKVEIKKHFYYILFSYLFYFLLLNVTEAHIFTWT